MQWARTLVGFGPSRQSFPRLVADLPDLGRVAWSAVIPHELLRQLLAFTGPGPMCCDVGAVRIRENRVPGRRTAIRIAVCAEVWAALLGRRLVPQDQLCIHQDAVPAEVPHEFVGFRASLTPVTCGYDMMQLEPFVQQLTAQRTQPTLPVEELLMLFAAQSGKVEVTDAHVGVLIEPTGPGGCGALELVNSFGSSESSSAVVLEVNRTLLEARQQGVLA